MKTITTQTQTGPRTVAGLKREIHKHRQMAEKWARNRDKLDFERERGRRWLFPVEELVEESKAFTQAVVNALTLVHKLEAELEAMTWGAEERAREWWANLERTAREAEEEAAREMSGAKRAPVGSKLEERGVANRYFKVDMVCRKSGEKVTRWYASPWKSTLLGTLKRLHGGGSLEAEDVTECSEAEYVEGVKGRAHRASQRTHLN